jgi:hypothetical protein
MFMSMFSHVILSLFTNLVAHCDHVAGAAAQLIQELQRRFPEHAVLDALGICYPQYWLQKDAEITFSKHLDVLKNWYCNTKVLGSGVDKEIIPGILDRWSLDSQQGYFKIAMKSNAPLPWNLLTTSTPSHEYGGPYLPLGSLHMVFQNILSLQKSRWSMSLEVWKMSVYSRPSLF